MNTRVDKESFSIKKAGQTCIALSVLAFLFGPIFAIPALIFSLKYLRKHGDHISPTSRRMILVGRVLACFGIIFYVLIAMVIIYHLLTRKPITITAIPPRRHFPLSI